MDRVSKNLLDYLIKNGGCGFVVYFGPDIETIASALDTNTQDLLADIDYLDKIEYIRITRLNEGCKVSFCLTHSGRNYKSFKYEKLKNLLFKSVLIPVIVALLTAFITTVIGYMWTMSIKNQSASFIPNAAPIIEDSIVITTPTKFLFI